MEVCIGDMRCVVVCSGDREACNGDRCAVVI